MRNSIIGLIVGVVLGIVLGATVIAPRLQRTPPAADGAQAPPPAAADIAKQLPRALVARPAVSLNMASAFAPEVPVAGDVVTRIDNRIWEISRGQIEIRAHRPGELAPVASLFEAVGSGAVDAAFASPGIAGESVPALYLFAGMPFGPSADEFLAWMQTGGGQALLNEINAARQVHGIPCGLLPATAFGWFRRELLAPQDLKELRMQVTGLGALTLARLGVDALDLPMGNLMLGLEQGEVDAISHGAPAIDLPMEFGTWLKVYYPQGWTQSLTMLELMINLKKWAQLNAAQQSQIETLCGDNIRFSLAAGEAAQYRALQEIAASGVQMYRLPPAIRDALERGWQQVVQQMINEDAEFRRVWQSLTAFRADFAIWRDLSRR